MKIDLFDFVGVNKNTKMLEEEIAFRKELHKLIANIITNEKTFRTENKTIVERLKLKFRLEREPRWEIYNRIDVSIYAVDLNESNIKKVQKYLDSEVYNDEDAY
jgi:hypothetical protein